MNVKLIFDKNIAYYHLPYIIIIVLNNIIYYLYLTIYHNYRTIECYEKFKI